MNFHRSNKHEDRIKAFVDGIQRNRSQVTSRGVTLPQDAPGAASGFEPHEKGP